ncbi:chemotaxis protein [Thiomicrospira aerophila AL3]|uniref:Chemotaxis protein CheA n=1 Tax=Thiomicrospira aerophila AL3 TaxID=717772 RepID=W0DWL8_9GAMM|nr:chemotaxis protein CheA [Thiomicrospira aerophila]AHF01653.1 chemotaxis protein [Thiomicrospira aerophila AL3]
MDMMEVFRQTYLEESFEGLQVMETGLLELPEGRPDAEKINEIFRAAHSIKGGSGTFGFSEIAGFTHVLETLLDEMRDYKRDVTQQAVRIMLDAVDILRDMLTKLQHHEPIDQERSDHVQAQMEALLAGEQAANPTPSSISSSSEPSLVNQDTDSVRLWHIVMHPERHLLQTGNEPLRIFRELQTLGNLDVSVDTEELVAWEDYNPEEVYLKWNLMLSGEISEDAINEVFEWIDGDGAHIQVMPIKAAGKNDAPAENTVAAKTMEIQPADSVSAPASVAKTASVEKKVDTKASADLQKKSAQADGSIRVNLNKIDQMVNLVGELVITQSMLSQFGEQAEQNPDSTEWVDKLKEGLSHLERHTRELQESVMNIRMLPVSFAFNRMPRIVHDVSQKLGKTIELVMEGENTELDKTMLEQLTDPLVHIVRNSIDHGIESPEKRLAAGKPEKGTVKMAAFHQGGNIVIQITDDGAGINTDRVHQKAIEKGVIEADANLSHDEIVDLIFHPGFSTAEVVSDVSGRGVGMDVVRRNIRGLGGSVEVHSESGRGSIFTIRLPLTLAILDGQLASVGAQTYVFPLVSIVESIQVDSSLVKGIAGQTELYKLRDQYIPVIRLHSLFGVDNAQSDLSKGLLVVVEEGGKRAGLFVDDLMGQQQVVIKSLENNFMKIFGVAGATILGDGKVALIIDVAGVVSSHKTPSKDKTISANKRVA